MDIYLIRHGETQWNREKRLQGVTDIPLNENGVGLAEKTAEGLKDVPFDRIYTSPLIRARRTAEIIRGERPIEIVETEGLLEISFGEYEGLVHQPDRYNIPDPDFRRFFDDPARYTTPPGGESIVHMRQRTSSFVKEIMDDPANRDMTFLMVSHGAAIRGILSGLLDLPVGQFWNGPVHRNCGVTKLHAEGGEFRVEFENRIYY
ncbi:MAG: histidine phosphatase family protein [Eubacteriales bacterium]|nr:histidine phosphatase family protein [Eubacteriales bacterium]